jgi:integrase/recombinase XerD
MILAADEHRLPDFCRRNTALIALLADTGLRIGELDILKFGDVRPIYKGREIVNFELHVNSSKTSHARVVPFSRLLEGDLCAEYFARYYLWLSLEKKQSPGDPLFFWLAYDASKKEDQTTALHRRAILGYLVRCARKGGVDKPVSAHDFRHFYGTYSYINGMDLHTLQNYMGHARIETTMRYIHVAERITGEALKHSATVGLKAQKQSVGYAALLQQLGRKA